MWGMYQWLDRAPLGRNEKIFGGAVTMNMVRPHRTAVYTFYDLENISVNLTKLRLGFQSRLNSRLALAQRAASFRRERDLVEAVACL